MDIGLHSFVQGNVAFATFFFDSTFTVHFMRSFKRYTLPTKICVLCLKTLITLSN